MRVRQYMRRLQGARIRKDRRLFRGGAGLRLSAHSTCYARSESTLNPSTRFARSGSRAGPRGEVELSAIERKVLNCIQEDIPLTEQPFKILADRIGIEEVELLGYIKALKNKGIIRRFAAGLNHRKLGFKSSLVALRVPNEKLADISGELIKYNEVTHCYLRKGEYSLWVVFIYKNGTLKKVLDKLAKRIGRDNILSLPTRKQFKLKTTIKF